MAKKRKHPRRIRQIKWRWKGLASMYCKTKRAFTAYEMQVFAIRRLKELDEAFKHVPPYPYFDALGMDIKTNKYALLDLFSQMDENYFVLEGEVYEGDGEALIKDYIESNTWRTFKDWTLNGPLD